MNYIEPEKIVTADGSETLLHPVFGQSYRSERGAAGESSHVFITNGLAVVNKRHIRILEVGFGSGLNTLLTLRYAVLHRHISIDYTTVEAYRISPETASELQYVNDESFMAIHTAEWECSCRLTDRFTLTKYNEDFTRQAASWERKLYDLVYFDAFAPDVQPEMWDPDIFLRLHRAVVPGGIVVTYSSKGIVKRALRESGFAVERIAGALGKHHMTRATRITR